MTPQNLIDAVQNINGTTFIGMDTLTQVKLKGGQKNPQQGRITKRMTGAKVMAFQNKNVNGYAAMVHRRLEAEGKDPASFVLHDRKWGTRIPDMPVVVHNKDGFDKYYLEVIFLYPGHVEYFCDGVHIHEDDIEGLPEVTVDIDDQGGLTNKVVIRDFSAESITELRIDGKVFN